MPASHTFYGPHPETLGDGTPLANGSTATPNLDDPHDRHLIERGWLMEGVEQPAEPTRAPRRRPQED